MIERVIPCSLAKLGYPSEDSRSIRLFLTGHHITKFFLCGRGNAGVGGKSSHEIRLQRSSLQEEFCSSSHKDRVGPPRADCNPATLVL